MAQLKTQTGTEADFFQRGRAITKTADAGEAIPKTHLLTFADPADMLAVLVMARPRWKKSASVPVCVFNWAILFP